MKVILGDNQFFGVNHFDLGKGLRTKEQFIDAQKIESFISNSLSSGMDGFMINSNDKGYKLTSTSDFDSSKEIHYSIPYPHKYANLVNEKGMLSLFKYCIKESKISKSVFPVLKLLLTGNLRHLVEPAIDLEVPRNLKKGNYVYLQNIITDLLMGMGRGDILITFIKAVVKMGYKPGIITLNPIMLDSLLKDYLNLKGMDELIVCFNINKEGFNVFPSLSEVEELILSDPKYKMMGMSIFASGAANIPKSIDYVKSLNLDYVVFGTSKLENVKSNLELFRK